MGIFPCRRYRRRTRRQGLRGRWVAMGDASRIRIASRGSRARLRSRVELRGDSEGGPPQLRQGSVSPHNQAQARASRLAGGAAKLVASGLDFVASGLRARLRKHRVQKKYQTRRPLLVVHGQRPDTLSQQNISLTSSRTFRRQVSVSQACLEYITSIHIHTDITGHGQDEKVDRSTR